MIQDNHEAIFAAAWNLEGNTSIELDPLDVNKVLADEYEGVEGLALTHSQIWEMEVKKAFRPDLFIPGMIRAGTARSWGRRELKSGDEVFIRVSEQRLWLQPDSFGTVVASSEQPLFHVAHGVSGAEETPLNTWRIVQLVSDEHGALAKRFMLLSQGLGLPEYVERYIEDILKSSLTRK